MVGLDITTINVQSNITTAQLRPVRCPEAALLSEFNRRAHGRASWESGRCAVAGGAVTAGTPQWKEELPRGTAPPPRSTAPPPRSTAEAGAELPGAVHDSQSPRSRSPGGRAPAELPDSAVHSCRHAIEYRKKSRPVAAVHHCARCCIQSRAHGSAPPESGCSAGARRSGHGPPRQLFYVFNQPETHKELSGSLSLALSVSLSRSPSLSLSRSP